MIEKRRCIIINHLFACRIFRLRLWSRIKKKNDFWLFYPLCVHIQWASGNTMGVRWMERVDFRVYVYFWYEDGKKMRNENYIKMKKRKIKSQPNRVLIGFWATFSSFSMRIFAKLAGCIRSRAIWKCGALSVFMAFFFVPSHRQHSVGLILTCEVQRLFQCCGASSIFARHTHFTVHTVRIANATPAKWVVIINGCARFIIISEIDLRLLKLSGARLAHVTALTIWSSSEHNIHVRSMCVACVP